MRILFSPCHYVYDEISGGEIAWAFNIADRISNIYPNSVVVTGSKNLLQEKKYKIIEVQPNKQNIDLSVKNAAVFSLKYFSATKKILSKNKFEIMHHLLPFSINSTFNLNFIFNKNNNLVIGPIQSPLAYKDLDINLSDIRNKTKQKNLMGIFFNFIFFLVHPMLKYLSKLTLKRAGAVVVINQYTKDILIHSGIKEQSISIIPPGIDIEKFAYLPFESKNKEKIELLVVCYLIKRKGVDLIIKSIRRVIKNHRDITLRIVGDGPQKENLERLVKKFNLGNFVVFEGFIKNSEVQAYYKRAHIFVNMSRSEGFATVCLEAMASGLAIVSSKVGGFSDAIENGKNGFLVEQEDWLDLAKKIKILLDNHHLISNFGENARARAEKYYDWQKVIIPKYLEIYKSTIARVRDHEKYYYDNPSYSQILENQDPNLFKKYADYVRKYSTQGSKILDVGCGVGQMLSFLKKDNLLAYGVDISASSIKKCRTKELNCRCYEGKKLPFANGYFDLVGSYNVLEHTDQPESFLAEQLRVLKKEGCLIIVCPNFLSVTNSYHYRTKGVNRKIKNLAAIIRRSISQKIYFTKMKTVKRASFSPDDDACNVTNPQDILKWAKVHQLKLIYWSSQPVYKKGPSSLVDFSFFRIFLGSLFMVFRKP